MLKIYRIVGLVCAVHFIYVTACAQHYIVKESATIEPNYDHEVFKNGNDGYLVINYSVRRSFFTDAKDDKSSFATVYDKNLKQIVSSPVKGLTGNKYAGAIGFHGRMNLLYTDDKNVFYSTAFDPVKAAFIGNATTLFTEHSENMSFASAFSDDSAYCYLLINSRSKGLIKDKIYSGVVMDSSLNIISKFSFGLSNMYNSTATTQCVISNKGMLYIISGVASGLTSTFRPTEYYLSAITKDGAARTTRMKGLPDAVLGDIVWTPSESGFSFTCLLSKNKRAGFDRIGSGNYDINTDQSSGFQETDITRLVHDQFAYTSSGQRITNDGIPGESSLLGYFKLSDQGLLLVYDDANAVGGDRNVYSGGVYVVRIGKDRNLQWLRYIPRMQLEPVPAVFSGSMLMPDKEGGVYLYFHDANTNMDIKQGDKIARATLQTHFSGLSFVALHVTKDGNVSKKAIIDDSGTDYKAAPGKGFLMEKDAVIYASLDGKFHNNATYRIGRIIVN